MLRVGHGIGHNGLKRWGRPRGWRCAEPRRYRGTVEAKRGSRYLVVTRLYGSYWVTRDRMYGRDHNGRTWTTPLWVEEPDEDDSYGGASGPA